MDEPGERLLTVREVSAYSRVGDESVRCWLWCGQLRGVNFGLGPGWRMSVHDLGQFTEERHTKPSNPDRPNQTSHALDGDLWASASEEAGEVS